jgi:hypothetical protein
MLVRCSDLGVAACSVALMLLSGCGASSDNAKSAPGTENRGAAGAPGSAVPLPASLSFTESSLSMAPGEARELRVQAIPAGSYRVRFTLLGEALDASLSQSEVVTAEDGAAAVTLTAPTTAPSTTFTVRAAIDTLATASLDVSVSSSGVARVQVVPHYGGHRTVAYWLASAHVDHKCADLSGTLTDGDPTAQGLANEEPLIDKVPVGRPVALTVRAGHFATGCTDASDLKLNLVNRVTVEVYDLPLRLDGSFSVVLGADSVAPSWTDTLAAVLDVAAVDSAVLGSDAADDRYALLDAMQELAPLPDTSSNTKDFATARRDGSWDQQLAYPPTPPVGTVYKTMGETAIRNEINAWLTQGLASMASGCTLTAVLDPAGTGSARLTPTSFAGVSGTADKHGLGPADASWSADPDDTLLLGARLAWQPSKLLASLAQARAVAQTGAADAGAALASAIDCGSVAKLLLAAGANQGTISFGACDERCTVDLCAAALAQIWKRSTAALPATSAVVDVSATAKATADDEARPTGAQGTWKGTVTLGSAAPSSVSGPASFTPIAASTK